MFATLKVKVLSIDEDDDNCAQRRSDETEMQTSLNCNFMIIRLSLTSIKVDDGPLSFRFSLLIIGSAVERI